MNEEEISIFILPLFLDQSLKIKYLLPSQVVVNSEDSSDAITMWDKKYKKRVLERKKLE
jgi:hypothetical protein